MYQRSKIVKHEFRTIAALAVSLMVGSLVPAVKADEVDKKTNIKIDQAIDVQGTILPTGSYVLKLLGSPPDRYTVQIFNARENHVIATILANPVYRLAGSLTASSSSMTLRGGLRRCTHGSIPAKTSASNLDPVQETYRLSRDGAIRTLQPPMPGASNNPPYLHDSRQLDRRARWTNKVPAGAFSLWTS
jgi:hypothetical protein